MLLFRTDPKETSNHFVEANGDPKKHNFKDLWETQCVQQ